MATSSGGRTRGGLVAGLCLAAILAAASAFVIPSLLLAYLVAALLVVTLIGVRRGIPELGLAAAGIVAAVGAVLTMVELFREPSIGAGAVIALGIFVAAVGFASTNFGRALAHRTTRHRAAWVAFLAGGIAAVSFVASALVFAVAFRAADDAAGGDPAIPFGLVLAGGLLALLASLATMIVSGIVALAGVSPGRPVATRT